MREHVKRAEPFVREEVAVAAARERFLAEGQPYKVELIDDLVRDQQISTVSLYTNGPFTDLCRGPHARAPPRSTPSRCSSVAGAYWRGDSKRAMLTRIYGTAFGSKAELDSYLERLELARARDHRGWAASSGFSTSPSSHPATPSGRRTARRCGTACATSPAS